MTTSPNGLPKGWEAVLLGDVTAPSTTKAEPSAFVGSKYLGLEHIEGGTNRILGTGDVDSVKSTKAVFCAGDVLYGKLRPYLNKVCRPDFDGVCSTDILVYPQRAELDNRYLLQFLSNPSTANFATQNASGINLPRVSAKVISEIDFPLPPLAEQRRIVEKIEALQERSRSAREALAEVGPLLEQFRQSLLAAAFRGDLTADWRAANPNTEPASELLARIRRERNKKWEQSELARYKAKNKKPPKGWQDKYKEPEPIEESIVASLPELPNSWSWSTWESVVSPEDGAFKRGPFGSTLKKSIFVATGYKVYEQYCPINDDCSYVRYYITPKKFEELKSFAVHARDFLISCSGVTLGRITQVPDEHEEGVINQALLRIRLNNHVMEDLYFKWLFRSPFIQRQIFDNSQGNAIPNVKGVNDLKKIPVPVPPLREQATVIRNVLKQLEAIEGISSQLAESVSDLTQLDQSILAKAFRGELVPQDPKDEPASELLERIRCARAEAQSNGKPRNGKLRMKRESSR